MHTFEPLRTEISDDDRAFLLKLTPELLAKMFWDSPWEKSESEVMARQTLIACKLTLKNHHNPFSWLAEKAYGSTGNEQGLHTLIQMGHFVIEDAPEGLSPPSGTIFEKGKPQVLRATRKLMNYAREELNS